MMRTGKLLGMLFTAGLFMFTHIASTPSAYAGEATVTTSHTAAVMSNNKITVAGNPYRDVDPESAVKWMRISSNIGVFADNQNTATGLSGNLNARIWLPNFAYLGFEVNALGSMLEESNWGMASGTVMARAPLFRERTAMWIGARVGAGSVGPTAGAEVGIEGQKLYALASFDYALDWSDMSVGQGILSMKLMHHFWDPKMSAFAIGIQSTVWIDPQDRGFFTLGPVFEMTSPRSKRKRG